MCPNSVDACNRTWGCTRTRRESAMKVDSWGKIPRCTSVNACNHTRGCTRTRRESAMKVDSWRKLPRCTRDLHLRQYSIWLFSRTLYQLSYPTPVVVVAVVDADVLLSLGQAALRGSRLFVKSAGPANSFHFSRPKMCPTSIHYRA